MKAWLFRRFRFSCPFSLLHNPRFRKPPSHPGRSDFPSPVGSNSFPRRIFPYSPKIKHSSACTPRCMVISPARHPVRLSPLSGSVSRRCFLYDARRLPRASLPVGGVIPNRAVSCTASVGTTRPSSLILAHAPDQNPPTDLRITFVQWVFAGYYEPLLEIGLSRRYLRNPYI